MSRVCYSVHRLIVISDNHLSLFARVGIAAPQNVLAVNLVVEQVEAERRLRLRLTIQLSLKGPDRDRFCKAHRQSPSPRHLRKHTRSQGPLLRRHYPASPLIRPCPTPAKAALSLSLAACERARHGLKRATPRSHKRCGLYVWRRTPEMVGECLEVLDDGR